MCMDVHILVVLIELKLLLHNNYGFLVAGHWKGVACNSFMFSYMATMYISMHGP